jgi:hypothetical protein
MLRLENVGRKRSGVSRLGRAACIVTDTVIYVKGE